MTGFEPASSDFTGQGISRYATFTIVLVGAVGFEPTRVVTPTTVSEWPLNQT